jgi:hypothetical protein
MVKGLSFFALVCCSTFEKFQLFNPIKLFWLLFLSKLKGLELPDTCTSETGAIFLVMCDPPMNEL